MERKYGDVLAKPLTYLLTYLRSWALLEKPPVVQPLKNFPTFYGTRRFITVFTRALHWSLSWARSIETASTYQGLLRIYWISSRGHPTRGGPPAWGSGVGLTTLHCKIFLRKITRSPEHADSSSSYKASNGRLAGEQLVKRRVKKKSWPVLRHHTGICRLRQPSDLRHELSSLARTLGPWVRIPLKAWMSVCVYSVFVLSCV
jgi:hypothetical protein